MHINLKRDTCSITHVDSFTPTANVIFSGCWLCGILEWFINFFLPLLPSPTQHTCARTHTHTHTTREDGKNGTEKKWVRMSHSLTKLKWLFSWKAGNGQGLQREESNKKGILAKCSQTSGINRCGSIAALKHTHTHTQLKHIVGTVLTKHSETSASLKTECNPNF